MIENSTDHKRTFEFEPKMLAQIASMKKLIEENTTPLTFEQTGERLAVWQEQFQEVLDNILTHRLLCILLSAKFCESQRFEEMADENLDHAWDTACQEGEQQLYHEMTAVLHLEFKDIV